MMSSKNNVETLGELSTAIDGMIEELKDSIGIDVSEAKSSIDEAIGLIEESPPEISKAVDCLHKAMNELEHIDGIAD
jgi:hypothetical protein